MTAFTFQMADDQRDFIEAYRERQGLFPSLMQRVSSSISALSPSPIPEQKNGPRHHPRTKSSQHDD